MAEGARWRSFTSSDAIDRSANYFVQWDDLDNVLSQMIYERRWMLITGPFQSGKSSFMYALADAATDNGFNAIVTTLTEGMVNAANNMSKGDVEASSSFFNLLAHSLQRDSGDTLKAEHIGGMDEILDMLTGGTKEAVWFIDEASLLNDIIRPFVITELLSGLRMCKQGCKSRNRCGRYNLRSFALVGTARMKRLLGAARKLRIERDPDYVPSSVPSSPARLAHDPYDPLAGLGSASISSLSLELQRNLDRLSSDDIAGMLQEYALERGVEFSRGDGKDKEPGEALGKIAQDICEQTSGYKGLVGSCCLFIQDMSINTLAQWRVAVRRGRVAERAFNSTVYNRIVSSVVTYSRELQDVIFRCVMEPESSFVPSSAVDLLPAINDGVLVRQAGGRVTLTSGMLLAAIIRDCALAYEDLVQVDTFDKAVALACSFMKAERLLLEEVLNANSQPSKYIWQSEFLLALKFVLERAYSKSKYFILVEAKKREKNGRRSVRMDFLLRNEGSPSRGFEVQGVGDKQSIIKHLKRSEKYRALFGCQMNYVYFVVESDENGGGDRAKAEIEAEAVKFEQVQCWHVKFVARGLMWIVERFQRSSGCWQSEELSVPSKYPTFMFHARQDLDHLQDD